MALQKLTAEILSREFQQALRSTPGGAGARGLRLYDIDGETGAWRASEDVLVQSIDRKTGAAIYGVEDSADGRTKPRAALGEREVVKQANAILEHGAGGPQNLKEDRRWRNLHNYDRRFFAHLDADGDEIDIPHDAFPCWRCGVYLPADFIRVDRRQALAKPGLGVIRCLGMLPGFFTRAVRSQRRASAREVGGDWMQLEADGEIAVFAVEAGAAPAPQRRLALTDKGRVIATLMRLVWGGPKTLGELCANNLLSLAPICLRCDRAAEQP